MERPTIRIVVSEQAKYNAREIGAIVGVLLLIAAAWVAAVAF